MCKVSMISLKSCLRHIIFAVGLLLMVPLNAQNTSTPQTVPQNPRFQFEGYSQSRVNPLRLFGSPFCNHFAEFKYFGGWDDYGVGVSYSYLPEIWGGHVTAYVGEISYSILAGAEYRLSKPWNDLDWHLYGSFGVRQNHYMGVSTRPLAELGLRVASGGPESGFCFSSGTIGVMYDGRDAFVTIGFGLSITALASAFLLLGI